MTVASATVLGPAAASTSISSMMYLGRLSRTGRDMVFGNVLGTFLELFFTWVHYSVTYCIWASLDQQQKYRFLNQNSNYAPLEWLILSQIIEITLEACSQTLKSSKMWYHSILYHLLFYLKIQKSSFSQKKQG